MRSPNISFLLRPDLFIVERELRIGAEQEELVKPAWPLGLNSVPFCFYRPGSVLCAGALSPLRGGEAGGSVVN